MKKIYEKAYLCTSFAGCALNSYMLTRIRNFLHENSIEIVNSPEKSDLIIISTCANLNEDEEQALEFVKTYIEKYGNKKKIILCGCLPKINPFFSKERGVISIGPKEIDKFDEIIKPKKKIGKFTANILNKILKMRW